jgi:hypothetical protein
MNKKAVWKRNLIILFLGIIMLSSLSVVSAIQGVCTGEQTCFCSGKAVSCPCNADPCVICGPSSPECIGVQTGNQQTSTGDPGTGGSSYTNPQTPGDFLGLIGNGIYTLVLTAFGQPSTIEGKVQASPPTTTEIILSIIALTAILATITVILKAILAKILISKKGVSPGMSKAQPSRLSPRRAPKMPRKVYNPRYRY